MTTILLPANLTVQGHLVVTGNKPKITRSDLTQDTAQPYFIPWEAWRKWDAVATNLPGTSATDDLGLYDNTFGTGSPAIETYDVKAAGAQNLYARAVVALPPEYDDGETVTLRANAGMVTTVADTSCTLDFVVYEADKAAGIGADLCDTAAIDINGDTTLSNCDYTITATTLAAGDLLDIRMHVAVNDGGTGTVVKARIGYVALLLDIKG